MTIEPGAAFPAAGDLETGVQIGDFRIERRLGAGSMGIVYHARQISLNRSVALKVLGQALSRGTDVARFQREAQAAARLRHPSIAQVYYIGQDRHVCFIAMELVDGISLRRVLDRLRTATADDSGLDTAVRDDLSHEPEATAIRFDIATEELTDRQEASLATLPLSDSNPYLSPKAYELRTSKAHIRRCAKAVRDAADALAHAHDQGVVHRDIKPDNLLLDRQGQLHLIDFGVARFFEDQAVTYTGQLVGTPLYMSPEQVTGRGTVDGRTDIYSLGLVLYELLTLRPPVEATNRENLLRNIVTKELPPVAWRNVAVPEDLARIVHRATQKDPDKRYATAKEMAADLDRFRDGKPVAAPPYHYRLDEGEITAARPGRIVMAAFFLGLFAAVISLGLASFGIMMLFMRINDGIGGVATAMQLAIALGVLTGGIWIARGLLAARNWARWTGVVLFALLCVGSAFGLIALWPIAVDSMTLSASTSSTSEAAIQKDSGNKDQLSRLPARNLVTGIAAMYAVPLMTAALLGTVCIWSLVTRRSSEWIMFAAQLRLEHRQTKEQLL